MSDLSQKSLKWIACEGISLNPYNLSVPERLDKFGYALVFDEFGNGKTEKAQLCIHSVLSSKAKERKSSVEAMLKGINPEEEPEEQGESGDEPSILIICPESLLQNWYSCLVSEMGVDFKFVSDLGDTVSFYSKSISNLFIISDEQLKQSEQSLHNVTFGSQRLEESDKTDRRNAGVDGECNGKNH